ncbi:MAG: TonB-dependent siderophore receptor, partial [Bacteroidota bacterium]
VYASRDGVLDRGQAIFFGSTDLTSTPISFSLSQPGDYMLTEDFHLTLSLQHALNSWLVFNSSYLKYRYDEDLSEHRTSNLFLPDDPTVLQLAYIRRLQDRTVDNVSNYLVADLATGLMRHQAVLGFDFYQQDDNRSQWAARGDDYLITAGGDSLAGGGVSNFDLDDPVYSLNRDPETYTANWFSQPRLRDPARTRSYGVYVQDQITIGSFDVLLGLRHEWHSTRVSALDDSGELEYVEQTALLPRLGLVYGVDDKMNLFATFAQGFEPQNASIIQQPEVYGGPFDPETSDLLESGIKSTFLDDRLLTTASVYQITKRNVLVNAGVAGNPDMLEQRGEVRSRGLEIEAVGSIGPALQLTANYGLNETVITQSDDASEIGNISENAPRHQGGLWVRYTVANGPFGGVGFGGGARFVTERNTFNENLQLPGFAVFDASVSYTVDRFRLTAFMDNIVNETYWVGGYNYGRIYPGAPRSVRVKVGFTF